MNRLEVAALVATALLRSSEHTVVLPFSDLRHTLRLTRDASLFENVKVFSKLPSGYNPDPALPLAYLNQENARGTLVVYVSSNLGTLRQNEFLPYTRLESEWRVFRERNPDAKLVHIILAPTETVHVPEGDGVFNVGGFSDAVFDLLSRLSCGLDAERWTDWIEMSAHTLLTEHEAREENHD